MILFLVIIIIFTLLILQFDIRFTYHQKVLYLCYSTIENDHILYGKRETVKCIKLWQFKK